MDWSEQGIVVSARPHGETSAIVSLFTRGHGRHLGLVRGGRSRRLRPVLQPGNTVTAVWRARLAEHLGHFTVEPVDARAARLMEDRLRLAGLTALIALAELLPEREPHMRLFDAFSLVLDELEAGAHWPALMVRFELGLLDELGYGLALDACAGTGAREELVYVSPKSGRAVSRQAGAAYRDRLLALPAFLTASKDVDPTPEDILAGFRLTGFFLDKYVWSPRGLKPPPARERLLARLSA